MTGIAVGIRVFQDTGNVAPLMIAAFFAELPGMVGGTFTGILADRWDRRRVIMLGDAGQAAGTALLLISFLGGVFELWHLYAVMLVQGIFVTVQGPASSAAITMLVPERHRDRANGIQEMGFPLAGVIAPPLTGALYAPAGVVGVMAFDLLTFTAAMIVVALIAIPRPAESVEGAALRGGLWREMFGGWRYLVGRRTLLAMVIYIAFIDFLINGPLEMALPYVITVTGSEKALGMLLGAMNLGALAGAASIAVIGHVHHRMRPIMTGYTILGVMLVFCGIARHPVLLGAALFLVLFPLPLNGALFTSILQTKTPADVQGRVFAVTGQIFMMMTPFSFLLTGALVDRALEPAVGTPAWEAVAPLVGKQAGAGMGLLLVIVGIIIVMTTLTMWSSPRIRRLEASLPGYVTAAAPMEE